MASHVVVPDPAAGPQATGRLRHDHRVPEAREVATPLVLVGGMTQTVSSWGGHMRPLSQRREVVAYEARGQGSTELSLSDCSFERHVEDFVSPPPTEGGRSSARPGWR